jgi:hypothetical protein
MSATDYMEKYHGGSSSNNLKDLRDNDSAVGKILQDTFELSDEDMAKGEIKVSDGYVTITSSTNDDDVIKRITTEEFD